MRTRQEIKIICKEMVNDHLIGWTNTKVLELSYMEYLKYEKMVNKILRKYTPVLNVSENKHNKTITFSIDERCPYNIIGSLFNAMTKSDKHFEKMSIKKFRYTKLVFLNNLKKRKEWKANIDCLRKNGRIECVKHSDEINRIKEALEV